MRNTGLHKNLGKLSIASLLLAGALALAGPTSGSGSARGPLTIRPSKAELDALLAGFDTSKPVLWGKKPATYGFEAEAQGDEVSNVVRTSWFGGKQSVRTDKFPYLDPFVEIEKETGNTEVISLPESVLDTTTHQMKQVRRAFGDSMSNFHIHIRVPKEAWKAVPPEELKGWLSRVADTAMAWRLDMRSTESALDSATHSRLYPENLSDRGVIRAQTAQTVQEGEWEKVLGSTMDIELRGFMEDVDAARRLSKIILYGLKHPEMIHGFYQAQANLVKRRRALADVIDEFAQEHHGRALTRSERQFLKRLEEDTGNYNDGDPIYKQRTVYDGTSNLPLYDFEHAPYLTEVEAQGVRDANFKFRRGVFNLMKEYHEEGEEEDEDAYYEYRDKIKKWADELELHSMLERSLLLDPAKVKLNKARATMPGVPAAKGKPAGKATGSRREDTAPAPEHLSLADLREIVEDGNDRHEAVAAIESLAAMPLKEARQLIRWALLDDDEAFPEVEEAAARAVADRGTKDRPPAFSEEEALPILKKALETLEGAPTMHALIDGLAQFRSPQAVKLLLGRVHDWWEDQKISDYAAKALTGMVQRFTDDQLRDELRAGARGEPVASEIALHRALAKELARRGGKGDVVIAAAKAASQHDDTKVRQAVKGLCSRLGLL